MTPLASIVIAAYRSERTIQKCLIQLRRQTFRDFETIVVDSSESDATAALVLSRFPEVRYVRTRQRLMPGAARAVGIRLAQGSLIVSLDPDCYADARWLELLIAAHKESELPISGAIRCYGGRWFDHGVHIQKFGGWLPGGPARSTLVAAGASALYPRDAITAAWIDGDSPVYDTMLSYQFARRGLPTRFAPSAVVAHHHMTSWRAYLRERYERAHCYVRFRTEWESWSSRRIMLWILLLLALVRPLKVQASRTALAVRSGMLVRYFETLPIVLAGDIANHAGETSAHVTVLLGRARDRRRSFAS